MSHQSLGPRKQSLVDRVKPTTLSPMSFKALSLEQMGETTFCFGKAHLGKTFR